VTIEEVLDKNNDHSAVEEEEDEEQELGNIVAI
jgi:hypothetical protein